MTLDDLERRTPSLRYYTELGRIT